ncbi:MAG: hypothetical protein WBL37_06125 [Dehalococcoidales bacterium]
MPEKEIISLDQAQMAAERFVEGQFKNLKKIGVDKVKLASIGSILIYDIDGIATIGGGLINKGNDLPFKVQVSAIDGTVVGYDWQRAANKTTQDLK